MLQMLRSLQNLLQGINMPPKPLEYIKSNVFLYLEESLSFWTLFEKYQEVVILPHFAVKCQIAPKWCSLAESAHLAKAA